MVSFSKTLANTRLFLASIAGTRIVSSLAVAVAFSQDLASASVDETEIQGLSAASAIPLTAARPILMPVNEPGPTVIAYASRSSCFNPACSITR